ncbi:MAG: CsbD family protein [Snowella sp.]|nr:CsbD family protein [Snowella sp.]
MRLLNQIRYFLVTTSLVIFLATAIALGIPPAQSWAAPSEGQLPTQIAWGWGRGKAVGKNLEGKAQEGFSKVTGDPKDQIVGKMKQTESQARNVAEDMKDSVNPKIKAYTKNIEGKFQDAAGTISGNTRAQEMGKAKQRETQQLIIEAENNS